MRATDPRLIVLTIALLALPAQAAQGHGPCQCSFPEVGEAGTKVKTRSAAYKVIINPRAEDFLIGPSGIESAYRPEAPRKVLLSRPKTRPLRGPSVRVPAAMPPGLYLILIFDGSEGGVHYTWDYFHVLGREPGATGGMTRCSIRRRWCSDWAESPLACSASGWRGPTGGGFGSAAERRSGCGSVFSGQT